MIVLWAKVDFAGHLSEGLRQTGGLLFLFPVLINIYLNAKIDQTDRLWIVFPGFDRGGRRRP